MDAWMRGCVDAWHAVAAAVRFFGEKKEPKFEL